jgi:hypothetical protein
MSVLDLGEDLLLDRLTKFDLSKVVTPLREADRLM